MLETKKILSLDEVIQEKLKLAAVESRSTKERYDFDSVSKEMRGKFIEKLQG